MQGSYRLNQGHVWCARGEGSVRAQWLRCRDGGSEDWHWWYWSRLLQRKMAQGFTGGQSTAAAGLLVQGTTALGASGHEGERRMQSVFLAKPPPGLYRATLSSRRVFAVPFRYSQRIWPFWPSCSTKKN